jgi:hypothetical protein
MRSLDSMRWMKSGKALSLIAAEVFGVTLAGWMLFDGLQRLTHGDYVRLKGELGPWAGLVAAFGIDPMSLGPVFVVLGVALLLSLVGVAVGNKWSRWLAVAITGVCLTYLWIGTVFAAATIISLLLHIRCSRARPNLQ